jgi:two-component system chemotaxis response regulator CheY
MKISTYLLKNKHFAAKSRQSVALLTVTGYILPAAFITTKEITEAVCMALPVLICDDSILARKQVRKSLPENFEVEVQTAGNGLEALAILRSQEIGLVFLDLTMPELDGVGVLEAIKAEAIDCFVIVISADIQPEMQRRVMELGALAFIQKPVNEEKLHGVLRQYGLF